MKDRVVVLVLANLLVMGTAVPAQIILEDGFEQGDTCAWSNADPLECPACVAGEFSCFGNTILQCDVGPPAAWVPTGTVCNPTTPNRCNSSTGTCESLQPIGNLDSTGTYLRYASFTASDTAFLGGYDVGSFGDRIYVNRSGLYLDAYEVELLDSDGDFVLEPNQHPSNPNHPGPMEQRVLTHVSTTTIPELGTASYSELFPLSYRVYFIAGNVNPSTIYEHIFHSGVTNIYAVGSPTINNSLLGFGDVDGLFFSGNETGRIVYSLDPSIGDWVAEFKYPSLGGGHFDGLEVVVDPNTGTQYVYVMDQASSSNYLGQYRRDAGSGWVKENLFQSLGIFTGVEGMGFGKFNHFWFTSSDGTELYEMGGADLTAFLE